MNHCQNPCDMVNEEINCLRRSYANPMQIRCKCGLLHCKVELNRILAMKNTYQMAPELTEAPLPYANPTHALRKSYAQNGIQVLILWD